MPSEKQCQFPEINSSIDVPSPLKGDARKV